MGLCKDTVLLKQPLGRGTVDPSTKVEKNEEMEVRDPRDPLRFATKNLCTPDNFSHVIGP